MKANLLFYFSVLISFSHLASATNCGNLNLAKCTFLNSDIKPILSNDKYQHFGMVAKGFGGKIVIAYREGLDHADPVGDSKIMIAQSADNGKTWNENFEPLSEEKDFYLNNTGVSLGYSNDGILIAMYVVQDTLPTKVTSWKYKISVDNGANWSSELDFRPYAQFDGSLVPELIPELKNGLPYGRIVAIPGTGNQVIASGYHSREDPNDPNGEFRLSNWKGTIDTIGTSTTIAWHEISPTATTAAKPGASGGNRYVYSEHSILPLSPLLWIAASRGPNSITIFKTIDGGDNWTNIGVMPDDDGLSVDDNPYHSLVAPMLDVMHENGEKYIVLLYTQRPCKTKLPELENGDKTMACSVLRIGKGVKQFIESETSKISWSDRMGISAFETNLSGYQSGVFLNNDISKYFHLEFHERSVRDSDIQARIINLKDIFSRLIFSEPEIGPNLLAGSYFNGLYGLSQSLGGSLGNDWNLVLSDAQLTVDIDDSDNTGTQSLPAGHPSHLRLNVEASPKELPADTNAYMGINQDVIGGYEDLSSKGFVRVSFYAKTNSEVINANKELNIYYYLQSLDPTTRVKLENITITSTWKNYERCFAITRNSEAANNDSDIRLTIGYSNDEDDSDLENDLVIDNILLRASSNCN